MRKLRTVGKFALSYAELLIALAVVLVVSGFAAFGDINAERLTQAAIALLAALAIAVMRERADRKVMDDRIDAKLATLTPSDRPWQVLYERFTWDIDDHGDAVAMVKKKLQFMQEEVFCVYEYEYKSSGTVKLHTCWGGAQDEPMDELPIIHKEFPGPEGRAYRLISLERVWRRGEIMDFQSFRELGGFFPGAREQVAMDVSVPTSRLAICIKWPASRKPTAVWLERTKRARVSIDLSHLRSGGDRWIYKTTIADPVQGERVIVGWDWVAPGPWRQNRQRPSR